MCSEFAGCWRRSETQQRACFAPGSAGISFLEFAALGHTLWQVRHLMRSSERTGPEPTLLFNFRNCGAVTIVQLKPYRARS